MTRVTDKQLQSVVERINIITGSPLTTYTKDSAGKFTSNIGNYHLDYAYGGVALHRIHCLSGGITDVLNIGHASKRELLHCLFSFIQGLETRQDVTS